MSPWFDLKLPEDRNYFIIVRFPVPRIVLAHSNCPINIFVDKQVIATPTFSPLPMPSLHNSSGTENVEHKNYRLSKINSEVDVVGKFRLSIQQSNGWRILHWAVEKHRRCWKYGSCLQELKESLEKPILGKTKKITHSLVGWPCPHGNSVGRNKKDTHCKKPWSQREEEVEELYCHFLSLVL